MAHAHQPRDASTTTTTRPADVAATAVQVGHLQLAAQPVSSSASFYMPSLTASPPTPP